MAVLRQIVWISVILFVLLQRRIPAVITCADRNSEYGDVDILFAPEFKPSASVMLNVLTVSQSQILPPRSVQRFVRRIRLRGRIKPWECGLMTLLVILTLSGDIEVNPGPIACPCTICSNSVRKNQHAILCSKCDRWTHAKCCGVPPSEYQILSDHVDDPWLFLGCLNH